MNKKGIGVLGIVIILAGLVIVIAGAYLLFSKNSATEKQWKKYTNDRLGFSIELPPEVDWQKGETLPLTIYEDGKSNTVFIATVDRSGKKNYEGIKNGDDFGWGITIGSAKTQSELDSFIKDNFGESCGVEKQIATGKPGHFYLSIGGSAKCIILAKITTIYAPQKQKVVTGFGKQDYVFYTGTEGVDFQSFDSQIIESFEFN